MAIAANPGYNFKERGIQNNSKNYPKKLRDALPKIQAGIGKEGEAIQDFLREYVISGNSISLPGFFGELFFGKLPYPVSDEIYLRLKHLINLKMGWDGYNAPPVSEKNAHTILKLFAKIPLLEQISNPQIIPGLDGDVQIEIHDPKNELDIHVISPEEIQVWILNETVYPEGIEFNLEDDFTEIENQLKIFVELYGVHTARS